MKKIKPICAYCGKPYGHRATKIKSIIVEIGQPIPTYEFNTPCIKFECNPPLPENGGPSTPEDADTYIAMDPHTGGWVSYNGRKGRMITRTYWDGSSYKSGYDPFCTQKCANHFAQSAYEAGYRVSL